MKKLLSFLTVVMLLMTACGEKPLVKEEIVIYHATDIHYLSQQLTDNSPEFVQMIRNGDGKMTHYIEQIVDAFVSDIEKNRPDYLIIGGDITFNGEKLSHEDFALKLKKVEESGTQVCVIPGNHDVDYPFSYKFEGPYYSLTDRMTKEDFEKIYSDFGLSQAYSRDEKSFSYFYRLTDKITLLALDTNTGGGTGVAGDSTIDWIEKELSKIGDGTTVIALTHQTLLNHFPSEDFTNQYTILNNGRLTEVFKKYNVVLNVSGHIHTQHSLEEGNIKEIATESMAVMPYNYGVITCNSEKISYRTQPVDVEGWAKATGQTDENLINFAGYSEKFYMENQTNRSIESLLESNLTAEERQLMAEFFAELNTYYFPGIIDEGYEYLISTDGYKKWVEKGENLWHYQYVMGRIDEGKAGLNHDEWEKSLIG